MAKQEQFQLLQDRKGMIWDIALYLPTVSGLGIGASIFWYGNDNQNLSYLLLFLACFFLYQGVHRILGRLMLLPTAPVVLDISKKRVLLKLKNGENTELVKDLRYYSDYAGKSFGLTGMDMKGEKRQFVFHKGQFGDEENFKRIGAALKIYA
ncbi:MAG: hypothetical protein GXP19_07690 [Gammaproteobacteria bacterium]|nr:hypothetical protein [Gammaproteobacteria bacterium]